MTKQTAPSRSFVTNLLANTGKGFFEALEEARDMLGFLGHVSLVLGRCLLNPRRLRFTSIVHNLEQTGVNALPIVGMIAILTSIVLAYQSVTQLQKFGAEIFMIDLIGISVLREMAVLLTAIIIAGRSGSAFAAQIGTMQVGEEVDALRTMGMDPIEVLVIPRVVALLIALPLLTFFADIMGLAGGAVMAHALLDISLDQYIERLRTAIVPWTFGVGLVKAPVFAFLIAMIGCMEGLKVSGSAESVGKQTTRAVVVSIFVIIIADALFSILFTKLGI